MVVAAKLVADIAVQGAEAAKSTLSSVGGVIGGLALAGGAALIGLGAKSVEMAGNFESSMVQLTTTAGESKSNIKAVSDGILNLAVQTGESTEQLSQGMYHVESAGYHGAAGLNVLRLAAEGAKAENANLTDVSNALVGTMNSYHIPASQAAGAMNALIGAVAGGNTTLQELSNAMAQVAPTAASLHIPFAQVAGAIDTMTNKGMSAQQASQNLAHVLVGLEAPGKKAEDTMENFGLSAEKVKDALVHQGLPEALQMIEDHVGKQFPEGSVKYNQALKDMLGGLVGFKLAAQLTGASLKDTEQHIKDISDSMKNAKSDIDGWSDVQGTFNFKMSQLQEVLQTTGIRIGTILLPWVDKAVDVLVNMSIWLTNRIVPALQGFSDWLNKYVVPALQQFGKWINDNVFPVLQKFWDWLAPKLGDAWKSFIGWMTEKAIPGLENFWKYLTTQVFPKLQQFWNWLSPILGGAWNSFSGWINNTALPALSGFWNYLQTNVFPKLQTLWDWLKNRLHDAWVTFATDIGIPKGDMNDFGKSVQDLKDKFQQFKDKIQELGDKFNTFMTPAVVALKTSFGDANTNIQTLAATITGIFNPGVNTATSDTNSFKNSVIGVGEAFAGIIYGATVAIAFVLNVVAEGAKSMNQIITGIKQMWDNALKIVRDVAKLIVDVFSGKWDDARKDVQSLVNDVEGYFQGLVSFIQGLLSAPFTIQLAISDTQQQIAAGADLAQRQVKDEKPLETPRGGHAFASGTNYAPGGLSLVGENGPEVMYIPRGAQIISNNQLSQSNAQQQQQVIVQAPNIYLDGRLIANGLMPQITNAIRYGTGINNF